MITAGVDVGTRFIKVCITDGRDPLGFACTEMGPHFDAVIKSLFKEARSQAQVGRWGIKKIIATGFGGHLVKKAIFTLSESVCTAKAAFILNNDIRTIVDVGGLFINVSTIDSNGFLEGTHINERCAAGSGKFLEMIAEAVGMPFERISNYAAQSHSPYSCSNNCAVFAESEIISQLNAGRSSSDVLSGVVRAVASKAATLLKSAQAKDDIALIGGVAKVPLLKDMLTEITDRKIVTLSVDSQLLAAFGAALIAQGKTMQKKERVYAVGGN
ncbi:MAG: acyl-CoA dehydratase activase [Deltaproteobacteria bacterium]|nr:acyl-CoA dehydratase activase [Deltaproteobacteria bacterium]